METHGDGRYRGGRRQLWSFGGRDAIGRLALYLFAIEYNRTRARWRQAENGLERRRLAGAVLTF